MSQSVIVLSAWFLMPTSRQRYLISTEVLESTCLGPLFQINQIVENWLDKKIREMNRTIRFVKYKMFQRGEWLKKMKLSFNCLIN